MSIPLNELWRTKGATLALLCSASLLPLSSARAQTPHSNPAAPVAPPTPPAPAAPPAAVSPAPVSPAAPAPAPSAPAPLDQGPDTLPPLDPPEVVELSKPQAVTVVAVGPARAPLPVRAERRLALLGELSWNGIAGFGPNLTFHAFPHVSFDLGAGLALVGWKLGLRTRYNFLKSEVTPFVGVGILAASGFDAPSSSSDNAELNIKLHPSAFTQATIGLDYTASGGFTFLGALGYAWLVSHDNVEIVTGVPTEEEKQALDIVFRSGVVVSIAIGYSFR
jgi:hypothetical protein